MKTKELVEIVKEQTADMVQIRNLEWACYRFRVALMNLSPSCEDVCRLFIGLKEAIEREQCDMEMVE